MNVILKITRAVQTIKILQVKYLNNILEQDHRFIKRITGRMPGFKAFHSASATLDRIEAFKRRTTQRKVVILPGHTA